MSQFLTVFIFLLFPSDSASSQINNYQAQNQTATEYICNVNNRCLKNLYNIFLNKKSEDSIYQVCESYYQTIRNCCINPIGCNEAYAQEVSQNLKQESFNFLQQTGSDSISCHLNNLSSLILRSS